MALAMPGYFWVQSLPRRVRIFTLPASRRACIRYPSSFDFVQPVGNLQGILSTLASVARNCRQNGYYNQWLTSKFPTRRNRELIGPYQGIKSAYQGNFLPDQGRALG